MTAFPALAQPLAVRDRTLRNRLVMAPLCTMYAAPDGSVTPRLVEYYRARARGGAGLVLTEFAFVDDLGSRAFHTQLGAHSDLLMPGLNELAETIQGEGALAGLQIAHCGSQRVIRARPVLGPSPIPWGPGRPVPRELTMGEIEGILEAFAEAAWRASEAGFDLVEIHGAHGYLVNAFLSPATNQRDDDYGGTPEKRLRFALELVRRVRERMGPGPLLSFRLNGADQVPGGLEPPDYLEIARALEAAGVDLLHISAGMYRSMAQRITPLYAPEAPFAGYAAGIKRVVGIPVAASGSIHTPETAEALVGQGDADLITMARPLLADPELPRKLLAGRAQTVVPCIRCNECVTREQRGKRTLCTVNPAAGLEGEPPSPSRARRTVLVIGGGPAGMQAALAAARRGHRVTLLEREPELGGQLRLAALPPFKKTLRRLLDYYRQALEAAGVAVRLGAPFDGLAWDTEAPDVLVLATGATWPVPAAFRQAHVPVLDPPAVLRDPAGLGRRVAVVGGGITGAETAWQLALEGHEVTLVERGPQLGDSVNLIAGLVLPAALEAAGVRILYETTVVAVRDGELDMEAPGGKQRLAVDGIVVAFGAVGHGEPGGGAGQQGIEVHAVGDRVGPRSLLGAIHGGDRVGRII